MLGTLVDSLFFFLSVSSGQDIRGYLKIIKIMTRSQKLPVCSIKI